MIHYNPAHTTRKKRGNENGGGSAISVGGICRLNTHLQAMKNQYGWLLSWFALWSICRMNHIERRQALGNQG